MKPGIRVVRGPDWNLDNQDGGLGFLGTVVKFFPDNRVIVKWDIGTETECRAGKDDMFDLRIYDDAQIGVKWPSITCDECRKTNLNGFRWKCLVCNDADLCQECYMAGCLEPGHPHVRYTTQHSTVVRVNPRRRSKKTPLYGIFPGAEVTEIWTGSDNRDIRIGTVLEIVDLDPDGYRGAVKVSWKSDSQNEGEDKKPEVGTYRVGAGGKVELRMVKPAGERSVYVDHLPLLDLSMPFDVEFNEGDRVRVDLHLDTFRPLMTEYGGWTSELEKILGEEGKIQKILDHQRRTVRVNFERVGLNFVVYANALTKIDKISAGDIVKIIDNEDKIKRLQTGHGGWQMSDRFILGEVGHVIRIDNSRDAIVQVNGQTYVLNPSSLVWLEKGQESTNNGEDTESQKHVPKAAFRQKLPAGVTVGVGLRVVRGPDWSPDFSDQDGGEGHLGSMIEICGLTETSMYPKQCVVIQWDNGERNVYRAGYEKAYDLRVYDTAGIGVKHDKTCSECKAEKIFGMLWQCTQCSDVYLCSECYFADSHDIQHQFMRYDVADKSICCKVPKRAVSKKLAARGIFEKSKVQRGPDWRWHNQDGGEEKTGEVIALVNFSPDTDRDAAEVTWGNGYTNVYRLGYKGRLDVKCVEPAIGGHYYRDHIPILKLDTELANAGSQPKANAATGGAEIPSFGEEIEGRFKEGDKVNIEIDVDLLKMIEENRGAWNPQMVECIGNTGRVIVAKGSDITVDFESSGKWTFHETVLNKLTEFVPGQSVRVQDSLSNVKMLQSGDWNELMAEVIGMSGKVEEIDEDGDIKVSFSSGVSWVFKSQCLQIDDGKTAEVSKPEPMPFTARTDEEKLQELFKAIFSGDVDKVNRIARNDPQLTLMDLTGKFAIHLACHEGQIEVAETLFKHTSREVLMELSDMESCTPLLAAVKGGQMKMVEWLVNQGANKDAKDQSNRSAIHMAVSGKNVDMVRLLRELQFNINMKDMLQQSAIFDAFVSGNDDLVDLVLDWPGIDVQYQDSIGFTPFCIACRRGNLRAVKRLLEMAPDEINKPKEDGCTGLHMAALNNHLDVVNFLLQQDDINLEAVTNQDKRTALHLACQERYLEVAKVLLDKGADPEAVDKTGKSALHVCVEITAEKRSNPDDSDAGVLDLAEWLLKAGVPPHIKDNGGKLAEDYVDAKLKAAFSNLLEKWGDVYEKKDQKQEKAMMGNGRATKPRRGSDPSLSVNAINKTHGQLPEMSQSVRVPKPQDQAPRIIDSLDNLRHKGQTEAETANDSGAGENRDPEMCESCEEEPIRYKIEPCEHLLCVDCIPRKKAKKKSCAVCGQEAMEIEEVRYS